MLSIFYRNNFGEQNTTLKVYQSHLLKHNIWRSREGIARFLKHGIISFL